MSTAFKTALTWVAGFALAFCYWALYAYLQPAHAQAVPATDPVPRVVFPKTVVGNAINLGPVTADAANAAKFSFGAAANGSVFANTGASLPTAGGASVPLTVQGSIPKVAVAKAIGRFALKVAYPLHVGIALWDLGKELGYTLDNSSGTLKVTKPDPSVCTVAPCYAYNVNNTAAPGNPFSTREEAATKGCQAMGFGGGYPYVEWFGPAVKCDGSYIRGLDTYEVAPSSGVPQESTVQAFEDAVAAKSGWPSSSALARATVDAIKAGESLQVEPQSITGPASQVVSQRVTNNTTNNTTRTETVTNNYAYDGAKVTVNQTTNTSTVNNATGVATTVASPSTPAVLDPELKVCGLPDTPPCKLDETGTPEPIEESKYISRLDDLKTGDETHVAKVGGQDDKSSMFSGWSSLFEMPPIAACEPYTMAVKTVGASTNVSLDPCAVVDGVRVVMAYLWALAAFWWCLGMVRESI